MLDMIHADRFAEARVELSGFALFEAFWARHGLKFEPFSVGGLQANIEIGNLNGRFCLTDDDFRINLKYKNVIVDFRIIDRNPADGVAFDQALYDDLSTKLETGHWAKIGEAIENLTAAEADATPNGDLRLQQAFQMATAQDLWAPNEFLAFCRGRPTEKVARLVHEKLPFSITAIADIENTVQTWQELALSAQIIASRMTDCFPETIKIEGTTAYVYCGA